MSQEFKNSAIKELFNLIKKDVVNSSQNDFKDVQIRFDNDRAYEFTEGVLEYERFILNLSIPSYDYTKKDCLGVYLHFQIPQYENFAILFEPNEKGYYELKISFYYKNHYFIKLINELNNKKIFTKNECVSLGKKLINIFIYAYKNRQEVIKNSIKKLYPNVENMISFNKISVDFMMPVTKGRNNYLFFYSENLNTVFFNDVFKTNYKSVINGIEEIAFSIISDIEDENIDIKSLKWINIFININNSGIIFQDIKLHANVITNRKSWIEKFFLGKEDEEYFKSYSDPSFDTASHLEKNRVIEIWNEIFEKYS